MNYLHFPTNITQTQHTHPSLRIGVVLSGCGVAILPNTFADLQAVNAFILSPHVLHSFNTTRSHVSLLVFHPDSDKGPTDDANPTIFSHIHWAMIYD